MNFERNSNNKNGKFQKVEDSVITNGIIERIVYYNSDSDYTVARFTSEIDNQSFTAVGYLGGLQPGENIQLTGSWVQDSRFGTQLKVSKYRVILPSTKKGIISFLSSGLIHGIGKRYAERIVEVFGEDTLKVISQNPQRLNEVRGLGEKRINNLLNSWKENYAVRDIMMFLQNYDISCAYAAKIYKRYGFDSIDVVKTNPYRLATEVTGIGFIMADKIASSMGIDSASPIRIEAGIIYVLWQLTENGHVYSLEKELVAEAEKILNVSSEIVSGILNSLVEKGTVIQNQNHKKENIIYLDSLLEAENGIVFNLRRLLEHKTKTHSIDAKLELEEAEKQSHISFSKAQSEAIFMGLSEKILVITGGPGTGKTTIIRTLVEIYKKHDLRFLLSAPTGRAARRLAESTLSEAKTIHRLLEFKPNLNMFSRNEENYVEAEVVIIDEASMIDILLMYHLLNAIPDNCIFILVGDVDQLPSVGPGKVLKDIISSGIIPTIKLDTIFRQEEGSKIILNAHRINSGEQLIFAQSPDDNFFFIQKENPEEILNMIEKLVVERIPAKFGFNPLKDVQILTPMYKSVLGVTNLNEKMQALLNPNEKIPVRRHLNIAVGDKVMQVVNNYEKDIYNGDIGFINSIDTDNQKVFINFDNRVVDYDFNEMDDVTLAYAITIHKSQGSEYNAVIIPVVTQHYTMLQRNLLYTAVTRGKKLAVLIGTKKALGIAIRNNHIQNRYSNLSMKLSQIGKII
ncbi:MAG: hypothetical protein ACD_79C01412G0003 [uncultured bacterium]|nr:MAG: hypothetical protein ACD_79C01412G0003 [uncultured bacterium]